MLDMANLFLVLWGALILFSIVDAPTSIPTSSVREFLSPTAVPAFIICRLFDDGHSDWREVIPHCRFELHFSNISDDEHLFMCLLALTSFLEKLGLLPIFWLHCLFFLLLNCMSYLYILKIMSHQLQIFFQACRLSSHFVYGFLFVQKLMSLSSICFCFYFYLCQRMFCLCSLLGALWCLIFKSLRHFEFIFVWCEGVF